MIGLSILKINIAKHNSMKKKILLFVFVLLQIF